MISVTQKKNYVKIYIRPTHLFLQLFLTDLGGLNLFILLVPPAYMLLEIKIAYLCFIGFIFFHLVIYVLLSRKKIWYEYGIYIVQQELIIVGVKRKRIKLGKIQRLSVKYFQKQDFYYLLIKTTTQDIKLASYSKNELQIIVNIIEGEINKYDLENK